MSAIHFQMIKRRTEFCANGCQTNRGGRTQTGIAIAEWLVSLAGHPLGAFCAKCKREMGDVWVKYEK